MTAPLAGIKVLDITANMSGPFGTMILGDQGADVIKLEPPIGDPIRQLGTGSDGLSAYYANLNRSKRSVVLDLERAESRPVFERLLDWADVVVHNYRPAAAKSLGIDADAVRATRPQPHPRDDRRVRLDRTEGRPSRVRPRDPGDVGHLRSPAQPAHGRAGDGAQRDRRQAHRMGDRAGGVRRARRAGDDRRGAQRRGVHARRQRRHAVARRDDEPHRAASRERASRHRERIQALADPRRAHLVHRAHRPPGRGHPCRVRARRGRDRDRRQRPDRRGVPTRRPGDGGAHDRGGAGAAGRSRRARFTGRRAGRGARGAPGRRQRDWSRSSSTRCSARSANRPRRCGSAATTRRRSAQRHGSAPTTTRSLRCWRGERADPQAFGSRHPAGRQPPRHQRARHGGVASLLVRPSRLQAGRRAAPAREPPEHDDALLQRRRRRREPPRHRARRAEGPARAAARVVDVPEHVGDQPHRDHLSRS